MSAVIYFYMLMLIISSNQQAKIDELKDKLGKRFSMKNLGLLQVSYESELEETKQEYIWINWITQEED